MTVAVHGGGGVVRIGQVEGIPAHRIGDGGGDGMGLAVIGEAGGGAPGQRHSQRRNLGGSGGGIAIGTKGIVAVGQRHGDGGGFVLACALVGKCRRGGVIGAADQAITFHQAVERHAGHGSVGGAVVDLVLHRGAGNADGGGADRDLFLDGAGAILGGQGVVPH